MKGAILLFRLIDSLSTWENQNIPKNSCFHSGENNTPPIFGFVGLILDIFDILDILHLFLDIYTTECCQSLDI